MKKTLLHCFCLCALCACAADERAWDNELVLLEKPGSRALAEGVNAGRAEDYTLAQQRFEQTLKESRDPALRSEALMGLAEIAAKQKDSARQEALLKEAAALGDTLAPYELARLHATVLTPDTLQAITALAKQGRVEAMLALARIYRDGLAGKKDPQNMEHWYRNAIAAGSVSAAADLGSVWAEKDSGKPPRQALALLLQAATYDPDAVAQTLAGLYWRMGKTTEAVRWYETAAKTNPASVRVYRRLAQAYQTGTGVPQDAGRALAWNIKAAQAGSVSATEAVMRSYYNGMGTPVDTVEGERWLERLITLKPERMYGIAKDFAKGDGLPQSDTQAFALALRSAYLGNLKAARYVAKAYARGTGTPVNTDYANYWYDKAGITRPKKTAANRKRTHTPLVNPLIQEAQALEAQGDATGATARYRQAAEAGDTTAMLRLASAYLTGMGVSQNNTEALRWYETAAQQGNAEAQYRLGLAYGQGQRVAKDMQRARYWLEKAAKSGYPQAKETLRLLVADNSKKD